MVPAHVRRAHPEPVAMGRNQARAKTKRLPPRTERLCEKLQNRPLFAVPLSVHKARVAEEQGASNQYFHSGCAVSRGMRVGFFLVKKPADFLSLRDTHRETTMTGMLASARDGASACEGSADFSRDAAGEGPDQDARTYQDASCSTSNFQ